MGNIDISKLTGDWKKFAEKADEEGDKNGRLEVIEQSIFFETKEGKIFLQEAEKAGKNASDVVDFLQTFGAEFTGADKAGGSEVKADSAKGSELSNAGKRSKETHYKAELAKTASGYMKAGGVDYAGLVEHLKTDMTDLTNEAYYAKLFDAADDVASMFKDVKYNSKEDIEKLESDSMDKLKKSKNDELYDFKKDILQEFVQMAEAHQKTKEAKQLNQKYAELRKTSSREDTVKALKKEFKGSYFKDLISELEDTTVMADARKEVRDKTYEQRGKADITDRSDVRKAVKKELGDSQDKYTAKVFRDDRSTTRQVLDSMNGKRSVIKDYERRIAAENRVETIKAKAHSEEDLQDEVFKNKGKFEGLVEDGTLIKKNADGKTYDISALSDLIRDTISASDYRANYQKKSLKEEGEINNVIKNINEKTGVRLTRKEAKNLIDYCGFDRDKRNLGFYASQAYKGTIGGLVNGVDNIATGLLVKATAGDPTVTTNFAEVNEALLNREFPIEVNANNSINFDLNIELNTVIDGKTVDSTFDINKWDIMTQLAQAGFKKSEVNFEVIGNTIHLSINRDGNTSYEQMHKLSEILGENFDLEKDLGLKADAENGDIKKDAKKAIITGILISMALNMIQQCLQELPGEDDFLQTTVTADTLEGYERELADNKNLQKAPNAKAAIVELAQLFVKKDANGQPLKNEKGEQVLDKEAYQKMLEGFAGPKSFLNKSELINGIDLYLRDNAIKLKDKPADGKKAAEKAAAAAEQVVEQKGKAAVQTPDTQSEAAKAETPVPAQEEVDIYKKNEEADWTIDGNKYQWKDIAKVYPGLVDKYGTKKAVRMLKIAQATGDYSADNLSKLADLSFSNPKALKDVEGFDYDVWEKFRGGTGTVKLPKNFAGFEVEKDKLEFHKAATGNYVKDAQAAHVKSNREWYNDGAKDFDTEQQAIDAHKGKKINKHY